MMIPTETEIAAARTILPFDTFVALKRRAELVLAQIHDAPSDGLAVCVLIEAILDERARTATRLLDAVDRLVNDVLAHHRTQGGQDETV